MAGRCLALQAMRKVAQGLPAPAKSRRRRRRALGYLVRAALETVSVTVLGTTLALAPPRVGRTALSGFQAPHQQGARGRRLPRLAVLASKPRQRPPMPGVASAGKSPAVAWLRHLQAAAVLTQMPQVAAVAGEGNAQQAVAATVLEAALVARRRSWRRHVAQIRE